MQASGLQLYFKKRLWHRCFPVNFGKFLRAILIEQFRWLLQNFTNTIFSKYEFGISFKKSNLRKARQKKVDAEDEILNDGIFSNEKNQKAKAVVREIFLLYLSLSFVVTCFYSLSLVVPLAVTRCTIRLSFLNDPCLLSYHAQKFIKFCLFIHFPCFDIKSSRCFSGLSLISIILWEYCKNNIKTFWYYSYENKRIISWKFVRLTFFRLFEAFPPIGL